MRTDWRDALEPFVTSADFAALRARVRSAYDCEQILPAREHIYAALQL